MAKQQKNEKIQYVDDGSTLADMSSVNQGLFSSFKSSGKKIRLGFWEDQKAHFRTFFDTMKLMVLPMLVVMGFIIIVFIIAWILF